MCFSILSASSQYITDMKLIVTALLFIALAALCRAQLQFDDGPDEIAGDEVDAIQVYVVEFDAYDDGDDLQQELLVSQVLKSLENGEPLRFRRHHHQPQHVGQLIEASARK